MIYFANDEDLQYEDNSNVDIYALTNSPICNQGIPSYGILLIKKEDNSEEDSELDF
jgi:hypothetical protein